MNETFKQYLDRFDKIADKEIEKAIQLLKNKLNETHAKGYVLGMSGGLDCSTVAALCARGDIPCYLVSMPYGKSMKGQQENDAILVADTFNLELSTLDITTTVDLIRKNTILNKIIMEIPSNGNMEMSFANIAPRVRMTQLYDIAQSHNLLVLGTSNLSEIVMGYFTKWGDGAGDVEPIKHHVKSYVRILAKHLGVPQNIIDKAPSADLWEGQTDEKEMGMSYYDIDCYIVTGEGNQENIAKINQAFEKNWHKIKLFIKEDFDHAKFHLSLNSYIEKRDIKQL